MNALTWESVFVAPKGGGDSPEQTGENPAKLDASVGARLPKSPRFEGKDG